MSCARRSCRRRALRQQLGLASLRLKLENQQFTGSFKDRGAYYKLKSLTAEDAKRGVIAMSAGNHAQGVAYHAQRLGIPGHHRDAGEARPSPRSSAPRASARA